MSQILVNPKQRSFLIVWEHNGSENVYNFDTKRMVQTADKSNTQNEWWGIPNDHWNEGPLNLPLLLLGRFIPIFDDQMNLCQKKIFVINYLWDFNVFYESFFFLEMSLEV